VRLTPLRIAGLYAAVSAAWILLSDNALADLNLAPAVTQGASVAKGWAFVAITAIGLWWLLSVAARQTAGEHAHAVAAADDAAATARTLRLVVEAEEAVLRAATEQELFDNVCGAVVRDPRFGLAWIGRAGEPPERDVQVVAAAGDDLSYLDGVRVTWDTGPTGLGPAGTAIREMRTQVSHDVSRDARLEPWRDRVAAAGFDSIGAVPLVHDGERIGVLTVYSSMLGQFTPAVVAELERVAGNAAFGVDRIRAREERIRARARVDFAARRLALLHELDGAMLASEPIESFAPRIVEPLRVLVGADRAVITTIDLRVGSAKVIAAADIAPDVADLTGRVVPFAEIGPPERIGRLEPTISADLAQLARELPGLQPLVERGMQAGAVLPLTQDGQAHGALALFARDPGFLTPERLECAGEVVDELAIAVRQERLRGGLAHRDAQLAAIVEGSPNPIFTLGEDSRVRFANPAAGRVFRTTSEALVGLAIEDLVPDTGATPGDPASRPCFAEASEPEAVPGARNRIDLQARRLDGTLFPAEVLLAPISTPDGPQLVATVVDVSERAAFESRLRQAERLEVLGRFAGILAHDVRNFLTTIRWLAQALEPAIPEGHPSRPELDLIIAAGRDGIAMTKSVLEFARPTPELQGETNVAAHVEQLSGMITRLLGAGVAFERELPPDLPPAQIAPGALTQVLVNLATNARDAMPEGGVFRIAASVNVIQPGDRNGVSLAPGRYVRLVASDTGVGMDAATAGHAFEPFFTTKIEGTTLEGTGLGLATVFLIAGRLGGNIAVESAPDAGTTFTVDLPAVE
jgi:PAS domain S-box-containing protein